MLVRSRIFWGGDGVSISGGKPHSRMDQVTVGGTSVLDGFIGRVLKVSMNYSGKEAAKENLEREIFTLFAKKMFWPLEPACVESKRPPAPDILYTGLSFPIAFELVEICASDIANETAKSKTSGDNFVIWTFDPTNEILKSKLEKTYNSEHPVHLLCYTNGRVVTPDDVVKEEITAILKTGTNDKFVEVWYWGEKTIFEFSGCGNLISSKMILPVKSKN
ncbi:MAG: hypothetical protein ACRCU5_11205 [Rhizobiaceae bacterium]